MPEAIITDIRKTLGVSRTGKTVEKTRIEFEYGGTTHFIIMDGTPTNEEIAQAIKKYVKEHLGLLGKSIKV